MKSVYSNVSVHSTADGHLGCFVLEAILKSVSRIILVYGFGKHIDTFLSGIEMYRVL